MMTNAAAVRASRDADAAGEMRRNRHDSCWSRRGQASSHTRLYTDAAGQSASILHFT